MLRHWYAVLHDLEVMLERDLEQRLEIVEHVLVTERVRVCGSAAHKVGDHLPRRPERPVLVAQLPPPKDIGEELGVVLDGTLFVDERHHWLVHGVLRSVS